MTVALFKDIIAFYGEENILGLGFDNSAGITFSTKRPFSLEQNFVENIESVTFVCFDSKGNPFHVIKHVENIQAIYIRDSGIDIDAYDQVTVRG